MKLFNKVIERLYFRQKGNLALYDQFTGCLNRNWYERFAEREDCRFVTVVDINNLKATNDMLGHEAGDALILSVAKKLQTLDARVCRYGGDEFYLFSRQPLSGELMTICDGGFAFGETNRTDNLKRDLKEADQIMYSFKKASKASRRFA